jgi:hypothetical protein
MLSSLTELICIQLSSHQVLALSEFLMTYNDKLGFELRSEDMTFPALEATISARNPSSLLGVIVIDLVWCLIGSDLSTRMDLRFMGVPSASWAIEAT